MKYIQIARQLWDSDPQNIRNVRNGFHVVTKKSCNLSGTKRHQCAQSFKVSDTQTLDDLAASLRIEATERDRYKTHPTLYGAKIYVAVQTVWMVTGPVCLQAVTCQVRSKISAVSRKFIGSKIDRSTDRPTAWLTALCVSNDVHNIWIIRGSAFLGPSERSRKLLLPSVVLRNI